MNNEMDFDVRVRTDGARHEPVRQPFNILIAYDSPANARRALWLVDGLARQFGNGLPIQRDLWRFDILALFDADQGGMPSDATIDLIIVAAACNLDLPEPVKRWLAAWASRTLSDGAALVALLEIGTPLTASSALTRDFLRTLAAQFRLEFFAHESGVPSDEINATFASIHQRAEQSSDVLRGILAQGQPPSRWNHGDSPRNPG